MAASKKFTQKSPLNDSSALDDHDEISGADVINKNSLEEDDDFDIPLDDLETFDDFGSDDDDDY